MNTSTTPRSILMGSTYALLAALCSTGCLRSPDEQLGKRIFDDEQLSANRNQSCATCHGPEVGGTGPDAHVNAQGAVYEGSVSGRFGNRKPPAVNYATLAPRFDYGSDGSFLGGSFWDGRATGWRMGEPAAEQAQGPFLNPAEQALSAASDVLERVCGAKYGDTFRSLHGAEACKNPSRGYDAIAHSIVAFEGSVAVNQFSSKYDLWKAGLGELDAQEKLGLSLFEGKARCANCHVLASDDRPALFTDFTYDNLGVPKNPANPFYDMDEVLVDGHPLNPEGRAWVDPGLGGFLQTLVADAAWRDLPYVTPGVAALSADTLASLAVANRGKHRAPTLRNVDKRPHPEFVKAYGHNGYFKSLKAIVHFYNTRDVLPRCPTDLTEVEALAQGCWPAPEVAENLNTTELGKLGLADSEEDAVVAFLRTLSDGAAQVAKR